MSISRNIVCLSLNNLELRLYARNFEKLADEAGLSKPMVLKQVVVIADKILNSLETIEIEIPSSSKFIGFICERVERLKARII
ncbi:MAG: hypothetical protein COC24_000735 [Alphaproteobacteria bacterium]|nr:hypothetical protein [Alphaproteobacteria bacterium]